MFFGVFLAALFAYQQICLFKKLCFLKERYLCATTTLKPTNNAQQINCKCRPLLSV